MRHLVAAAYLTRGWSIFPVATGRKAPPLVEWTEFQHHLATLDDVREWWTKWPDANIGIVTGSISNLSVVDIDEASGGVRSLKETNYTFPLTRVHKTPAGFHLLYLHSMALHTGAGFLKGIDVRSDGGYIVAPPSVNIEKGRYEVFKDRPLVPLLDVPPWLRSTTRREGTAKAADPSWVVDAMRGVPEAQRNDTATRLAGYYHRKGLPQSVILTIMYQFARSCSPPMDARELEQVTQSVERYPDIAPSRYVKGLWGGTT